MTPFWFIQNFKQVTKFTPMQYYYNIYDASMGYFGKAPSEMNDYECTLLVGIPNAPSIYSLKVNPDLAHKRQSKVLECMVELEYISDEESEAIKEKADYSVK